MENQHLEITGYRDLNAAEIALMNEIKAEGERLRALVDKVLVVGPPPGADPLGPRSDPRWVAIGKTHLQQGLMALVRAVARPTTF